MPLMFRRLLWPKFAPDSLPHALLDCVEPQSALVLGLSWHHVDVFRQQLVAL